MTINKWGVGVFDILNASDPCPPEGFFRGGTNSVSGAGLADTPVSDMGMTRTFFKEVHLKINLAAWI